MQALNFEDDAHINDSSDSDCDNDEDEEELIIRNIKGKLFEIVSFIIWIHLIVLKKNVF